ncbi:MAG: zf-HC2 domain-containing protein, partial [Planctomycetota bacterium]
MRTSDSDLRANDNETRGGNLRKEDGHLRYLLTAYVFGDISPSGRREVERHVTSCQQCHRELNEIRNTLGLVEDALDP